MLFGFTFGKFTEWPWHNFYKKILIRTLVSHKYITNRGWRNSAIWGMVIAKTITFNTLGNHSYLAVNSNIIAFCSTQGDLLGLLSASDKLWLSFPHVVFKLRQGNIFLVNFCRNNWLFSTRIWITMILKTKTVFHIIEDLSSQCKNGSWFWLKFNEILADKLLIHMEVSSTLFCLGQFGHCNRKLNIWIYTLCGLACFQVIFSRFWNVW